MSRRTSARTRRKPDAVDVERADEEGADVASADLEGEADAEVVRDGFVLDFISGTKELKETATELVRQRIARALFHEYGISVDDMEGDSGRSSSCRCTSPSSS